MLAQLVLHRAHRVPGPLTALAATLLAVGLLAGAAPLAAQGRGAPRRMVLHRAPRRGGFMMAMSDPAARLLDQQLQLQLNGTQVTQLIAIHESTRKQQRALGEKMRALFPRQTTGQRQAPSAAQRDSLTSLLDAMRTLRWRAMSDADSVLTPAQRTTAARLAMAGRGRMGAGMARFRGGRGPAGGPAGGMNRMRGGFAPRSGGQPNAGPPGDGSGTN